MSRLRNSLLLVPAFVAGCATTDVSGVYTPAQPPQTEVEEVASESTAEVIPELVTRTEGDYTLGISQSGDYVSLTNEGSNFLGPYSLDAIVRADPQRPNRLEVSYNGSSFRDVPANGPLERELFGIAIGLANQESGFDFASGTGGENVSLSNAYTTIKEGYESLNPSTGGSGGSRAVSATSGGPSGGSGL